jgi:hypothetical protein
VIVTTAIALPLAGCTTTMHAAQRERLESARQRAALETTRVRSPNPLVRASAPSTLRSGGRTALIVSVTNRSGHAVTDLPISVGYTTANGTTVYLNSSANLSYFGAHLPAIRAGRTLTWVYTTRSRVPVGVQTFARVGRRPAAPALLTDMGVRIGVDYRSAARGRSLTVRLQNSTGVPQYELQVYAYARRDGHYVAAGNATVADLDSGASDRLRLSLVGVSTDNLHVAAIPTILQ